MRASEPERERTTCPWISDPPEGWPRSISQTAQPGTANPWLKQPAPATMEIMHKKQLADFLRRRRETLQPGDVGLSPGSRRRTAGLRREEVAALAGMSTDYYARLEQQRGPQPSIQIVTALARALRLTPDESDHLFALIGHNAPARFYHYEHVSPTLLRVLDRLHDSPALVLSDLGDVLAQNPLSVALTRDQTLHTGLASSAYYRWFTDPTERLYYPEEDHPQLGRTHVACLRAALTTGSDTHRAARIV